MGFTVEINITATPSRIWTILTDVESWPEWTSSMTSVTRLDEGPLALGSRARVVQPKIGAMVWTVTALTPRDSFVWRAARPGLTIVAGHYVHVGSADGVTVRFTVEQSGVIGRAVAPFTERSARRYVQLEAEGLRRRSQRAD